MILNSGNLTTLAEMAEALKKSAYVAALNDDHMVVSVQADNGRSYPIVLRIKDDNLIITCQVGTLGDIDEADFAKAAFAALASNAEILPYAFAILDTQDGLDAHDPIVLINSVPLGDFSAEELEKAMRGLRIAIHTAIDLMPWKHAAVSAAR